jgi:hypothetical protein
MQLSLHACMASDAVEVCGAAAGCLPQVSRQPLLLVRDVDSLLDELER